MRLERESAHSPPNVAEVKNTCGFVSTLPYISLSWRLISSRYSLPYGPIVALTLSSGIEQCYFLHTPDGIVAPA
jgi:hypothetical protein